jgi:hypothetical protein
MLEGPLAQLSSHVEHLFEESRGRARRELAEQLNQSARRMRVAESAAEVASTLVDSAAPFATGIALFRIEEGSARGERIRGVPEDTAWSFVDLSIPLPSAAAFTTAVETRDPVTALATPPEISEALAALLRHGDDARVQIFPLVTRDTVTALLYAWGSVQGPVLELLVQVASTWEPEEPPAPVVVPEELITIAPPPAGLVPVEPVLSLEEERMHLRARRFARVEVSRIRLDEAAAVLNGRAKRDLYESLRAPIDAARSKFREQFCAPCATMVDYLHQEMLRTLAHDDAELFGKDYPGPVA